MATPIVDVEQGVANTTKERKKALNFIFKGWFVIIAVFYLLCAVTRPIDYLLEKGFNEDSFSEVRVYFHQVVNDPIARVAFSYKNMISNWFTIGAPISVTNLISLVPFAFIALGLGLLLNFNPYSLYTLLGSAHKAKEFEIEELGLYKGFIIVLGRAYGRLMRLNETLSAMCFAPPGAGKTAGVVVPTVLGCDTVSMIVNDPKPEIAHMTSGHRSQIGITFTLNWAAEDNPAQGIYWPCWNPLDSGAIPPAGPDRDMYVDSMVNVLVEDPKGSSADPHWSKTGRAALSGFIHYIVSKTERALANDYFFSRLKSGEFDGEDAYVLESYYRDMVDPSAQGALQALREGKLGANNFSPIGTWKDIPKSWHGRQACIPMILDWITEAQIQVNESIRKRKQQGDQMAALADPMKELLENAVMEGRRFAYTNRAILEFTQLAGTPDKERGSILSTALTGIGIFKNAAVRARTSNSDFTFKDLRGMIDPRDGKMKPVTVYLSVEQVYARALGAITGMFVELMSNFLISNPPNRENGNVKMGPYPVLFVLDEFPQMPKLAAVIDGPAVGRGQKVSYLLIAQDFGQIIAGYGSEALETLITTTAAKIILTQNNEKTADRMKDWVARAPMLVESGTADPGAILNRKETYKIDKDDIYGKGDIMTLKPGEAVVILQGQMKKPIAAESPRFFKDPLFSKLVKIPAAPHVPEFVRKRRKFSDIPSMTTGG
jgi:type IV secretory pathway TraG/TraD family ATPase VirD4